jgi:hypothetical protein
VTDEPLQPVDALAVSRAHALLEPGGQIEAVVTLAARELAHELREPYHDQRREWFGYGLQDLEPPAWAIRPPFVGGTMELWFNWTDAEDRPEEPRNQPIFLASLVFDQPSEEARIALQRGFWPEWFRCDTKHQVRISALRYLSELATSEITLTGQAEQLAGWAQQAFVGLKALTEPPGNATIASP